MTESSVTIRDGYYGEPPRFEPAYRDVDFEEQLKNRIPSFQIDGSGYYRKVVFAAEDSDEVVNLCYWYWDIVRDYRRSPLKPGPHWEEQREPVPFDLIPELRKVEQTLSNLGEYGINLNILKSVWGNVQEVFKSIGIRRSQNQWEDNDVDIIMTDEARRFWTHFRSEVLKAVKRTTLPDRRVKEMLPTIDHMGTLWSSTCGKLFGNAPKHYGEKYYPQNPGHWIAAVICSMPGTTFREEEVDGELRFVRYLPSWLLQVLKLPVKSIVAGKEQNIVSWCVLPRHYTGENQDTMMHVSAVGGITALKALYAWLVDSKSNLIYLPERPGSSYASTSARREKGNKRYIVEYNDVDLSCGLAHIDITHFSAFRAAKDEQFLHLVGNIEEAGPDLELFYQQLEEAISVPLRPEWAEHLWECGSRDSGRRYSRALIRKLPSYNCNGWIVLPNEQEWTKVAVAIQMGVDPETLRQIDIETVTDEKTDDADEQEAMVLDSDGGDDEEEIW